MTACRVLIPAALLSVAVSAPALAQEAAFPATLVGHAILPANTITMSWSNSALMRSRSPSRARPVTGASRAAASAAETARSQCDKAVSSRSSLELRMQRDDSSQYRAQLRQ